MINLNGGLVGLELRKCSRHPVKLRQVVQHPADLDAVIQVESNLTCPSMHFLQLIVGLWY